MLLEGTNIITAADKLNKIKLDYLYHSLRNPKPEIETRIRQLRIVRHLDVKQYSVLKRQLPYIVCGMFNPPFRRTENFAYIEYFIADIDKLSEKELSVTEVRAQIEKDERTVMCFLSPGEDGLKVLFRLKERCYDAGIYSLFYKAFIKKFSIQYGLEQVIDIKTCDVCRACFFSIDPDVYFHQEAVSVDMNTYLDVSNATALFDLKYSLEKEIQVPSMDTSFPSDPDSEIIDRIKARLNPNARIKKEKLVYVPQRLNEIIDGLKEYIEQTGVILYEIINIQYGKKLRLKTGTREAEINLFFGKRGFSVVQSPRSGTSEEFNVLIADMIECYLAELV
ncbi:hypothetical protein EZS27_017428 [termite gut metagenome]|uniref:BT4734-like N-terminal domain-containing protein n=1 Tax=termite gut metagenome TaxID=433724 RepID=A0A5J4RJ98_9ZZZZ